MLVALVFLPAAVSLLHNADAQVMSSSNYQIESDSVNIGGGYSSSTNYQSRSTVGEIGTGRSSSASYSLRAGYQQMNEVYIAMTGANSVALAPSIPGVTGGISNGQTSVKVTTDSLAGYQLSIRSDQSPAMRSGSNTIADYVPAGSDPDFTFTTTAADAHLGFTPEGNDIVSRFRDNGSSCNTGSLDTTDACWDGLSTSNTVIAEATGSNHPDGASTTIRFRVGVGSAVIQPPGLYVATTTVTALPL